jgi:hypothetical protein
MMLKDTQRGNIPQKKTLFRDKILVQFTKKIVTISIEFLLEIFSRKWWNYKKLLEISTNH